MSINWSTKKWGNLQISPNQTIPSNLTIGSHKKLNFLCSCGRTYPMIVKNVTSGVSSSCGHCNNFSKEYWLRQTWGKLRLDPNQELPDEWSPWTHKPMVFNCNCGRNTILVFKRVHTSHTNSCNKCLYQNKNVWLSQKWGKLKIDPNQILPDEWSEFSHTKLFAVCDCGNLINIKFQQLTTLCSHPF